MSTDFPSVIAPNRPACTRQGTHLLRQGLCSPSDRAPRPPGLCAGDLQVMGQTLGRQAGGRGGWVQQTAGKEMPPIKLCCGQDQQGLIVLCGERETL